MRTLLLVSFVLCCAAGAPAQSASQAGAGKAAKTSTSGAACRDERRAVDIPLNGSGVTEAIVSKPGCARILVNALHYITTPSSIPDFTVSMHPALPLPDPMKTLDSTFENYVAKVQQIEAELTKQESKDANERATAEQYLAKLNLQILESDSLLPMASGPKAVLDSVRQNAPASNIQSEIDRLSNWQSADTFVDAFRGVRNKLEELPLQFADNASSSEKPSCAGGIATMRWQLWYQCRGEEYEALKADLDRDVNEAALWSAGSGNAVTFERMASLITYWNSVIQTTAANTPGFYPLKEEIGCRGYSHKVIRSLSVIDRTALATSPKNAERTEEVSLVGQCNPSIGFSVGGGFGFQTNRKYEIVTTSITVSGASTTANVVEQVSSSKVNPYPLAMAHVRLWNFSPNYALYGAFGAGASINSHAAGGSSVEFLTGFSVLIHRRAFVTGGIDVMKHSSLSGGLTPGSQVTGLTTVPITSSYGPGFGIAFTYRFY